MIPTLALVGRPNVGKSTLFNAFTHSRDALVANIPGVTRDRQYGRGMLEDQAFIVIDTGGIADEDQVAALITQQVESAIAEADLVLFVVDGRAGINTGDHEIAQMLRRHAKPVMVVVNKTDGLDELVVASDFYQLGFAEVMPVAASHRRGTLSLLTSALEKTRETRPQIEDSNPLEGSDREYIRFAIIGRPNVGKSTLTNRILGEPRVLTLDLPGTTTDSIYIPFERHGAPYVIVDTAGVRRKSRVDNLVEKFSVIKTLDAIEKVDVIVMLLDAREGLTEQDMHLMGHCLNAGRALILAVNKWDGLSEEQKRGVRDAIDRKLAFLSDFVEIFYISAEHGTAVGDLFPAIHRAYASSKLTVSPSQLTKVLEQALSDHAPPMVQGRRVKLRYAHMGGQYPPMIIIHGTQTDQLSEDYQRYLMNQFRVAFKVVGSPIRLELRSTENPFAGKKNKLTPHQEFKRKRLLRFVKKK